MGGIVLVAALVFLISSATRFLYRGQKALTGAVRVFICAFNSDLLSEYFAGVNVQRSVAMWMVPTSMTNNVHAINAREGGSFRISFTYGAHRQVSWALREARDERAGCRK